MDLKDLTIKELFKLQYQVNCEILKRIWWILLIIIIIGGFITWTTMKKQ